MRTGGFVDAEVRVIVELADVISGAAGAIASSQGNAMAAPNEPRNIVLREIGFLFIFCSCLELQVPLIYQARLLFFTGAGTFAKPFSKRIAFAYGDHESGEFVVFRFQFSSNLIQRAFVIVFKSSTQCVDE